MKQKPLVILLFIIVLTLGVVFFGLPQYHTFSDLRLRVEEKQTELKNKETYFSELNRVDKKLEEFGQDVQKVDSALPQEPQIPDVLNFLGKTSSQSGLVLKNVELEKTMPLEKEQKFKKTTLAVSLSGIYPAFLNFLSELQKSARLIGADLISFSSPETGEIFDFNLKIRTFSY